jgi:hypothetical protein
MDPAMSIPHPTVRQIAISRIDGVGVIIVVSVTIRAGIGKEGCAQKSSVVKTTGKESVVETIDSGAKRAPEGGVGTHHRRLDGSTAEGGMGTHHRRSDGSTAEGRVGSHHRRRGGCTPERGANAAEASVKSAEPSVEATSESVDSTSTSVESASAEASASKPPSSVEAPASEPRSTAKSCSPGRRERGGRQAERQSGDSNQIASHGTTFQ